MSVTDSGKWLDDVELSEDADDAEKTLPPGGKGGAATIQEAHETIAAVMKGAGGRNAIARLSAAKLVLERGEVMLSTASTEQFMAEAMRRGLRLMPVEAADLDKAEAAMLARQNAKR